MIVLYMYNEKSSSENYRKQQYYFWINIYNYFQQYYYSNKNQAESGKIKMNTARYGNEAINRKN